MKTIALVAASVLLAGWLIAPMSADSQKPDGKKDRVKKDAGTGGSGTSNGINYNGGPVMHGTTHIYYIWYGTWDASSIDILTNLANNIGGSPYFNTNTSYYDSTNTYVSNSVTLNASTTDNYSRGKSLSDADIAAIVSSALSSGKLPVDANGVYFVLTATDVVETSGFTTKYCGWHTFQTYSGQPIKYAFVGNAATQNPAACEQQTTTSPSGNPGADGMASVIAHELEESVTDPLLNAWYDSSGNENADKCAWTFGAIYPAAGGSIANIRLGAKDYLIQQNWVNAAGGYCALSYGADYSLTVSPSSQTVAPGGTTGNYTVTVNPINGFSGTVNFSVSGLPSGATASAIPSTSTSTTFTISTTASLAAGSYPFTITGSSGTLSHFVTATLVVSSADFSLSVVPSSESAWSGGTSGNYTVTVNPIGGFSGTVTFSITGLPSGATASIPATATSATFSISTSASVVTGTYPFTITGTSGSLSHTASATLIQNPNVLWTNRKAITVNHTKVSGASSLNNFPMLYSVTDANLKTVANGGSMGKSDGTDILFTAADGVTKLNHELEYYNPVTGQVIAWVQLPLLSPSTDTDIYIYYGNAAAVDQQNKNGTWDSNYKAVWHLPNGTTLSLNDSTASSFAGTNHGATATTGQIDGGAGLDGSSAYLSFASAPNIANANFTVSGWSKRTAFNRWSMIYSQGIGAGDQGLQVGLNSSNNFVLGFWGDDLVSSTAYSDSNWHYMVGTFSTSTKLQSLYVDGILNGTRTATGNYAGSGQADIGTFTQLGGYFYPGSIDEVRVSNAVRSAAWIATEYNNQNSASTFFSVGAQQGSGGPAPVTITVTSAPPGLALTVDGSACTAPCLSQWTPGTSHSIAVTSSPQAGAAGTQYVYSNWSDGLAQSHSVSAPSAATTYTASFTTQYFLTTSAGAGGTISPASGWYNSGAVVPVSAIANSGYQFSGFTGALTGSTPQNLAMNQPSTVTANFSVTGTPWYNPLWTHREAISVNHTKVSGTSSLSNFPMVYSVTDANLKTVTNGGSVGKSDGTDILFTAADGVTKLNHELEFYNPATGQVIAWVQLSSLSPTTDTAIYIYYGNTAAADQQNKNGTWDSNYLSVWHLPNGTTLTLNDSTAGGFTGTNHGASATTGEIDGGASLDGSSAYVSFASAPTIANANFTVSGWSKRTAPNRWSMIYAQGPAVSDQGLQIGSNSSNNFLMGFWGDDLVSTTAYSDSNWHYVVGTFATSTKLQSLYVDGILNGTRTASGNYTGSGQADIGTFTQLGGYFYPGSIDEVRVSNTARSAAWIATEYNNQSSPSTFFSVGAQQ